MSFIVGILKLNNNNNNNWSSLAKAEKLAIFTVRSWKACNSITIICKTNNQDHYNEDEKHVKQTKITNKSIHVKF